MKTKKNFGNRERRTFYLSDGDFNKLKDKLSSLGFQGHGFLTRFAEQLTHHDFILLIGSSESTQKFLSSLNQNGNTK